MSVDAGTPQVQYPDVTVQLSGEDGSAFAIMGRVSEALRRQVGADAAQAYSDAAMNCESYDELLQHAMRTVNVE